MQDTDIETSRDKALTFFQRAREVASTDNFDYAIELYLDGIKRAPESVEDGHIPLRKISHLRQSKGGKKPSMVEKIKHKGGKNPVEALVSAEYLLSKDPENLSYLESMLIACAEGGFKRTAEWSARLIFSACKASDKPSISTLELLKNKFQWLGLYELAISCCAMQLEHKPDDMNYQTQVKNLSALATISKGKYETADKFSQSVKDMGSQQRIWKKESGVRDEEYLRVVLEDAFDKYNSSPGTIEYRLAYAKAMADVNDDQMVDNASKLLEQWYEQTQDFAYQKLHNEIAIRCKRDKIKHFRSEIEIRGKSDELLRNINTEAKELADLEIAHYKQCCKVYPSEHSYKYELGLRYIHKKDFDAAIPMFQQASRKPVLKIKSMNLLGMCFFNKGWYADAIDVFENAIKSHPDEDDIFKELRYNLARSCELDGRKERALTIYRKLAQMDYEYRDVAKRVSKLRDV